MKMIVSLIIVMCVWALPVQPESIYSLITNGRIKEASDSLSTLSTASLRDGNYLFYQSLLEPDAKKAVRLMEAALHASVATTYRQEISLRLAQYYFINEEYGKLRRLITDYRTMWENGKYSDILLRYAILVDEDDGQFESALRQVDRYLVSYTKDEQRQWGRIDKARILLKIKKRIGADKLLRSVSKSKSGPGVPLALYLLTSESINHNRIDDAVFYYNLFQEAYPYAVGLDNLLNRLGKMSTDDTKAYEADKLTGTYYSVQVGVFSKRGNARKQAELFKQYGYKVEIQSKVISNVKYRVVYVGRFKTYEEAAAFKKKLEAEHHEPYQVVAR